MNSKIVIAFLLVTISAVLAHPGFGRDDAIISPVAIALDAAAAPPASPSSEAPAAAIPEEQPTSPALLDDATGKKSFYLCKVFKLLI